MPDYIGPFRSQDLIDFVRAQVKVDEEAVFHAECRGHYRIAWLTLRDANNEMRYTTVASDHFNGFWSANGDAIFDEETGDLPPNTTVRVVLDGEQILRDCQAKREIITRYEFACDQADAQVVAAARGQTSEIRSIAQDEAKTWDKIAGALEYCVRSLACAYRERDGYESHWEGFYQIISTTKEGSDHGTDSSTH